MWLPYLNRSDENNENDANNDGNTDLHKPRYSSSSSPNNNGNGNENTNGEVPCNSLAELCDNDVITSSFFFTPPQVYNIIIYILK